MGERDEGRGGEAGEAGEAGERGERGAPALGAAFEARRRTEYSGNEGFLSENRQRRPLPCLKNS